LRFTVTNETVGSIKYLTQGAPNLDFKQYPIAGTCAAGTYTTATACTVNLTFAPTVPGERNGAVVFYYPDGNVLASVPVNGYGLGPQVVFGPGARTTLGGGFQPNGVAVDGSGNVYAADSPGAVVLEMPPGCASSACVTTLGGGFSGPTGVTVDGTGNVYVADFSGSAVYEMPPGCASSSCLTTLGGGFGSPNGVAVDGTGNVYVADYGKSKVYEMPAGCVSASCVTTLGGGFSGPTGVAVDGTGTSLSLITATGR
jgi:sugar lactone lactonase YvrE